MNFTTDQWNDGCKIMKKKFIQYIKKENLFFLKDLLEPWKTNLTNISLQYQENAYIAKLDDIVNKYNKIYHTKIRMKLVDVKPSTYIELCIQKIDKNPKLKVSYHVRISQYKTIFAKGYVPD